MQNSQKLKSIKRFATLAVINVAIALLLFELLLQVIFAIGWHAEQHQRPIPAAIAKIYWCLQPHTSWEEYFAIRHASGDTLVYGTLYRPHPTRGWSAIPDARMPGYTINHQGYRSLYPFEEKPGKYEVMIVGDSFTFGDDIDDQHTWPQLLQTQNPALNVLNMGGSGYGTDQMLVTLEEEIQHYHPDLVIVAYIDDDMKRAMIPFRDYQKPRFFLQQGKLHLTNTPVGDAEQVLQDISRKRYYSYGRIQVLNLFHYFTTDLTMMEAEPDTHDTWLLNTAIVERMQAIAADHHADFLLLYLPVEHELVSSRGMTAGEYFLESCATSYQITILDPRQDFLRATFPKSIGHYKNNENTLLSQLVMQKITSLESWKRRSAH